MEKVPDITPVLHCGHKIPRRELSQRPSLPLENVIPGNLVHERDNVIKASNIASNRLDHRKYQWREIQFECESQKSVANRLIRQKIIILQFRQNQKKLKRDIPRRPNLLRMLFELELLLPHQGILQYHYQRVQFPEFLDRTLND
jgi:hypothetical protein